MARHIGSVVFCARTVPCPRCASFNTQAIGDARTDAVILRHCRACRYHWDEQPFEPPSRMTDVANSTR